MAIIAVMKKSVFLAILSILLPVCMAVSQTIEKVAPGIWKIVFGMPEKYLPTGFKESPLSESLKKLAVIDTPPFNLKDIQFRKAAGGIIAGLPVDTAEKFYGFGLQ